VNGLNVDPSTSAYNANLAVFNNALYATWDEGSRVRSSRKVRSAFVESYPACVAPIRTGTPQSSRNLNLSRNRLATELPYP
jgi:hypothetical protein